MTNQIQEVLTKAVELYKEWCPAGQELSTSEWPDLWHEVCQPLELAIRAEMRKASCNLEAWTNIED